MDILFPGHWTLNLHREQRASGPPLQLACVEADALPSKFLTIDRLNRFQAHALAFPGARRRYAVSASRARALFRHGDVYSYGALFLNSIEFSQNIVALNKRAIDEINRSPKSPSFGVHLRHDNQSDAGIVTETELQCIRSQLSMLRNKGREEQRSCKLLLASDRTRSIEDLKRFALSEDCAVLESPKVFASDQGREEHGPWSEGVTLFSDIYLLSQADAFLGSLRGNNKLASTFSMMIASLVAARTGAGNASALFLPTCQSLPFNGETGPPVHSIDCSHFDFTKLDPAWQDPLSPTKQLLISAALLALSIVLVSLVLKWCKLSYKK